MSSKQEVHTTDRTLTLTRLFEAPPELVFRAYSSCEQLSNWWGPRQWPMVECTIDFRVGGEWHYCMRGPNPDDASWGKAIYEEITEPTRLVYRDYFSDANGNLNHQMPSTRSTIEFTPQDGSTMVRLLAEYEEPADLQTVLEMGMIDGMTETLDRLDEYLVKV